MFTYEKIQWVKCPYCEKFNEVKFIRFGLGYSGHCTECKKIICTFDEEIEEIKP